MGSTLVNTGERIVCDDSMTVFVHGAYNLGVVMENRELTEALHPGEGIMHPTGAAGEDTYSLHTAKCATAYGVAEVDFGMIADCTVDYTITVDDIPGIPYHMNPGAYLRNIVCVDPTADINADQQLIIDPSTPGSFIPLIEVPLKDSVTGSPEAFNDAVVIGDAGAIFANRSPMRAAYFLTDPGTPIDIVAYITHG